MELQVVLTIISIVACIFSILALLLGVIALLKVMSMEKATHSVQFMPVEQSWADSEKDIDEINEEFQELNEDTIGF